MHTITLTLVKPKDRITDGYFFAVSSDTLIVTNNTGTKALELIIDGKDNNGYLCVCEDLDDFLDSINVIKEMIMSGDNPLSYLPFN